LERDSLVLLAAPRTDASFKGPQYPICRIIDRTAEAAAQTAQAEKSAAKKKEKSKELELNWAIAPHDLRTKMTQLKRFLGKGYHVTVTLMNLKKRDKRRASADEAKEVLKAVEATITEVPGAKETKPREGSVGDIVVLSLHAPAGSAARAAAAPAEGTPARAVAAATETAAAPGKPEENEA
jgi:translation initiation factor IF-3